MRPIGFVPHLSRFARLAWAAPCSLVGLLLGTVLLLGGGTARTAQGILLFAWRCRQTQCGRLARALHFRAITFGHVVLAVSTQELERLLPHERVHVRQYERWGLLFFLAYPASSLWQLLCGRNPYMDNCFEVEARRLGRQAIAVEPGVSVDSCKEKRK